MFFHYILRPCTIISITYLYKDIIPSAVMEIDCIVFRLWHRSHDIAINPSKTSCQTSILIIVKEIWGNVTNKKLNVRSSNNICKPDWEKYQDGANSARLRFWRYLHTSDLSTTNCAPHHLSLILVWHFGKLNEKRNQLKKRKWNRVKWSEHACIEQTPSLSFLCYAYSLCYTSSPNS